MKNRGLLGHPCNCRFFVKKEIEKKNLKILLNFTRAFHKIQSWTCKPRNTKGQSVMDRKRVEDSIIDCKNEKIFRSENYNYEFDKQAGFFARWGKKFDDDPNFAPTPEILDIEISTGNCKGKCKFCYKDNTTRPGKNMSLEEFKTILSKFPNKSISQIALGITDIKANPDFIPIIKYCNDSGIIPNFTTSGQDMDQNIFLSLGGMVGAISVSVVKERKLEAYRAIYSFSLAKIPQVNIQLVISKETIDFAHEVVNDVLKNPLLEHLNAIVFLGVKPKGRAKGNFNQVAQEDFNKLIDFCLSKNVRFGCDSCSAPRLESAVDNSSLSQRQKKQINIMTESCESGLFSGYINVEGKFFPCSFCEGEDEWTDGIDVLNCSDFISDVWNNDRTKEWRKNLLGKITKGGCRVCPVFKDLSNEIETKGIN